MAFEKGQRLVCVSDHTPRCALPSPRFPEGMPVKGAKYTVRETFGGDPNFVGINELMGEFHSTRFREI